MASICCRLASWDVLNSDERETHGAVPSSTKPPPPSLFGGSRYTLAETRPVGGSGLRWTPLDVCTVIRLKRAQNKGTWEFPLLYPDPDSLVVH